MRNSDVTLQLYFIRHGESMGNLVFDNHVNVNEVFDHSDSPLSDFGISQAKEAGKRFKGTVLDAVYISSLTRTRQTADEILKFQSTSDIFYRDDMVEQGTAVYENGFGNFNEDEYACSARAEKVIAEMRNKYTSGEKVLIVSHGVFVQHLIKAALGIKAPSNVLLCVYNASISKINFRNDGKVKLALSNDISHLSSLDGEKLFWM